MHNDDLSMSLLSSIGTVDECAYMKDDKLFYVDDVLIRLDPYKDKDGYLHKNNYLVNDHGTYESEIKYLKPELAVCECCGAPLKGNKCEYCGSTYIWR